MPALAVAPSCIKVQLIGTNQGALWMNNIFFATQDLAPVPQDTSQIDTFLTAIGTSWGATLAPLCNSSVFLNALTFTDLTDVDRVSYTHTVPTPIPGTAGAANLPVSVAMCLSWRVARRYRGGHGRIYVPAGLIANIVNGRTWTGTFLGTASTSASSFFTTLTGLSVGSTQVNLIVLSYFSGSHKTHDDPHPAPVPRVAPLAMIVSSGRVRSRVDTQRRRLGKEVG